MKCCGEELTSPFCPQCGERTGNSTLTALLLHVRKQQRAETERSERQLYNQLEMSDRRIKAKERIIKNIAKWKSWGDALEELMKLRNDS